MYSSPVLPFGELVLSSDQSLAIWLGRCDFTDERILAKASSSSLFMSAFVTRQNLDSSRDLAMFKSISFPPPELTSVSFSSLSSDVQALPQESVQRSPTRARISHVIELAATSKEELKKSQSAVNGVNDVQLRTYINDDLSLFSATEIKNAKLTAVERLQGTYDQLPRTSLTTQQLKQVTQPVWTMHEASSKEGLPSLKASLVDTSFKQQLFDLDMASGVSAPSRMSLKILLTLSLINRWEVLKSTISSALPQAPFAFSESVLVRPPPELEESPDVLWRLTRALYGITHSPQLSHNCVSNKLEELGLRRNQVEPCIFSSEQLIVILHLDSLLIGGDPQQQNSFLSQLSASVSLQDTTKLDANTSLSFLRMTLEYSKTDHSISLHPSTSYYRKLLNMYGMNKAKATSILEEQLCHSAGQSNLTSKSLASERQQLYRIAVGHLLSATSIRPDISLAVTELSRSFNAPTQQDEQHLKKVLSYLKGTLHFTVSLQPPKKRVIERASIIHIQTCVHSTLKEGHQKQQAISGTTLSLWGVPLAAFSRTQVSQASSSADAELYTMGKAV